VGKETPAITGKRNFHEGRRNNWFCFFIGFFVVSGVVAMLGVGYELYG